MTKIEELKVAFEAATTGEWEEGDGLIYGEVFDETDEAYLVCDLAPGMVGVNEQDVKNGKFITLAHNLMPQLLAAVEVLKEIKSLLDDHPQAAVGNTKVHVAVCKATNALNAFKEDYR